MSSSPPPSPAAPPPSTNSTSPPPSSPPPSSPPPASPPPSAPPPAPATPPPASPPPSAPPPAPVTPPPSASPPPASSPPPSASPPPASSPPPVSSPPPQAQPSPPPSPSGQYPPPGKPPPPSGQPPPPGTPLPPKSPALPPPGPSPPTGKPPPLHPPPPPPPSKSSVSTPLAVGIAVGSLSALAILGIIWFCCFRKRRRDQHPRYGGPPGSNGNLHDVQRPNWQQNVPPPADDIVKIPPQLSPPPYASRPPNPPAPFPFPTPPPPSTLNSSGSYISNDLGSGGILLPPPSPGLSLGFSKSLFTYEELALATNGFSDANLLGQGGFGYVHKGTLPNGREVAVKQLKSGSGQGEREFQAEVEIISRVHHKHLVSLVGYCISDDQRLLVYEYIPNKTLDFHLHGKGRPIMDWSTRLKIALGSAKGLAYLHEDCYPKIIHRDIKGSNILLDYDFEAKVGDFGLAKFTPNNQTHISTRVMGSFGYIAPEYASSGKLTEKSDVYSFGVVLLELITGKVAYDPHRTSMDDSLIDWARPHLTQAVENGNYDALVDPWLEKNYNPDEMSHMVACAAACVRYSARNRPRMSQIVRSLEGDLSLEDLNSGVRPGYSMVYGSSSSSYDSAKYNEDMKNFKKLALSSQEYGSSEYSAQTSSYGQNPSVSSSEGQQTREMEMRKKKESQGFSSSSH